MNAATSFLDAGFLYGNSRDDEKRIRTYVGGQIKLAFQPGDKLPLLDEDRAMHSKFGEACDNTRPCKLVGE